MAERAQRRLYRWLWQAAWTGPTLMEMFMAVTAIRWAIYFILPEWVLLNSRRGTMEQMAIWLPAALWAAWFLALGLMQGYGAFMAHQGIRKASAFIGMVWWFVVAVLDIYAMGLSSGSINILQFSLFEWAVFMLLLVIYQPSDKTP